MKPQEFLKENEFIGDDAHQMHQSHQHHMLREECYHSAVNAIKLHKLIGELPDGHELDAWAAEKISLANDYLKTVAEWLEYEVMGGERPHASGMTAFDIAEAEEKFADLLGESDAEHAYVCVHAKKGQCEVTAKTSYEAARKAAAKWKLKNTAGVDAHLKDVKHRAVNEDQSVVEGNGPQSKIDRQIINLLVKGVPAATIARKLDIPEEWVHEVHEYSMPEPSIDFSDPRNISPTNRFGEGVAESAGRGEYYIWTVHFENPEKNPPRRVRVYSDEFMEEIENITQFYAKKGLKVVDVDTDTGIRSEPRVKPEPYEPGGAAHKDTSATDRAISRFDCQVPESVGGVAEGEITKTAKGLRHRSTAAYGGTTDHDNLRTLDKPGTNRIDRALDVKFDREKKIRPGLDLGLAEDKEVTEGMDRVTVKTQIEKYTAIADRANKAGDQAKARTYRARVAGLKNKLRDMPGASQELDEDLDQIIESFSSGISTAINPGSGPKTGTLFGGTYENPDSPFAAKKKSAKKSSTIKR